MVADADVNAPDDNAPDVDGSQASPLSSDLAVSSDLAMSSDLAASSDLSDLAASSDLLGFDWEQAATEAGLYDDAADTDASEHESPPPPEPEPEPVQPAADVGVATSSGPIAGSPAAKTARLLGVSLKLRNPTLTLTLTLTLLLLLTLTLTLTR